MVLVHLPARAFPGHDLGIAPISARVVERRRTERAASNWCGSTASSLLSTRATTMLQWEGRHGRTCQRDGAAALGMQSCCVCRVMLASLWELGWPGRFCQVPCVCGRVRRWIKRGGDLGALRARLSLEGRRSPARLCTGGARSYACAVCAFRPPPYTAPRVARLHRAPAQVLPHVFSFSALLHCSHARPSSERRSREAHARQAHRHLSRGL